MLWLSPHSQIVIKLSYSLACSSFAFEIVTPHFPWPRSRLVNVTQVKFFFGNFDAAGRFSANLYYYEQSYVIRSSYIFCVSLIFLSYNLKYL